ncbi:hypothetical protein [Streptobacillus moniliformis]|uniref:hypothetical protein n=1 Tax=Streptobacillus moniliformis TaxID=34105 RepID=UPI0007E38296|nr:hypothetical protein [Streptobacillus moniliformis]
MVDKIFISGNVPSSKNSKQWTGKFLINSKTVQKYLKEHKKEWKDNKDKFLEMIKGKELPLKVGFYFIRDSKRDFDYNNASQLPQDLMVELSWIEDDCARCLIPIFKGYEVDKSRAGVIITVE